MTCYVQISILIDTVCIFADVPEECNAIVTAEWSQIASVLYPHFLEPAKACSLLGLCVRSGLRQEFLFPA